MFQKLIKLVAYVIVKTKLLDCVKQTMEDEIFDKPKKK